jgi:peptide-methionine (S)-S-oxide reductase
VAVNGRAGAAQLLSVLLSVLLLVLLPGSAFSATLQGEGAGGAARTETAIFAGGCFWCMEAPFERLPGVLSVESGYTGGTTRNPTYEEVSSGATGHAEAVRILYDPSRIAYDRLLDVFWRNVDPTDMGGQFCDRGSQYRSEIFVTTEEQRDRAIASKERLEAGRRLPGPVVTAVVTAGPFWRAEEYHQHYYRKNPIRYAYYRSGCGRDRRLADLWGREGER